MEIVPMGRTQLDIEVILEYLESLKTIYTKEVRLRKQQSQGKLS